MGRLAYAVFWLQNRYLAPDGAPRFHRLYIWAWRHSIEIRYKQACKGGPVFK